MQYPIYQQDKEFLARYAQLVELSNAEGGRVLVAPSYQARVMTSTLDGADGPSFGWLNRTFIAAQKDDPKFNNYGGEDRFWLGPEGGQFGLWFRKGDQYNLNDFKTPPGINTGAYQVVDTTTASVAMQKQFCVTNYSGTDFDCLVNRKITLLDHSAVAAAMAVPVPRGLKWVGFESLNQLSNAGQNSWIQDQGLVCIWILGMFNPLPRGKIIMPFIPGSSAQLGQEITDYYGIIPADRLQKKTDHALFTCDGQMRTKIGLSPLRARNLLGSWDPDGRILTIVKFNLPTAAAKLPYVNSQWKIQEKPFAGDAVNGYNDGVDPDTGILLGPFYELETSSCALALSPQESTVHVHQTFHFNGDFEKLSRLSLNLFGVELWK